MQIHRTQHLQEDMEVLNDEKTIIQRIDYVLDKLREKSTEAEKEIEKSLATGGDTKIKVILRVKRARRLESSPQGIAGQTVGELSFKTVSRHLRDPRLLAEFSYNYAKFTVTSNITNLCYLNCYIFH